MLSIESVKQQVNLIKEKAGDPEHAHCLEDDLYLEVLEYATKHCSDVVVRAMAIEAIKTQETDFERWCA